MKRIIILAVAVVAAVAASCTKEQTFSAQKSNAEVTSIFSHAAKTELGDAGAVNWVANDSISVLYASENAKFVTAESGASVEFTGEANPGANQMYALYPYSKNAALDGSKITLEVPAVQTAVAGTFNPAAGISVGAVQKETESYSVEMMNVGALIQITINGSNISKVKFKGNDGETIAGVVEVDAAGTPSVSSVTTAQKEVSLIPGGQYFEPGTYYIAVLPATLTKGFTLTYYKVEESQEYAGEAVYSSEYSIGRSHLQPLGSKEGSVVWTPTTIVREYVFHDGSAACWPFDETYAPKATTTEVNISKVSTFISNDANHDVLYYYSKTHGYYIDNTTKMFMMDRRDATGGGDHTYFQTPAIKGLTLIKAVLTLGSTYPGKEFSIEDKSGQIGNLLLLGAGESEVVFNIPEDRQVENNWYRIRLRTTFRVQVKKLTLYFAGEEEPAVTYISEPDFADLSTHKIQFSVLTNAIAGDITAGIEYKASGEQDYTTLPVTIAGGKVSAAPAALLPEGDYEMRVWSSDDNGVTKKYQTRAFKLIGESLMNNSVFLTPAGEKVGDIGQTSTKEGVVLKDFYYEFDYKKTWQFFFWGNREITWNSSKRYCISGNPESGAILLPTIDGYTVGAVGIHDAGGSNQAFLTKDVHFTGPDPRTSKTNLAAVKSNHSNVSPIPTVNDGEWTTVIPDGKYDQLWIMSATRWLNFTGMYLVYYAK